MKDAVKDRSGGPNPREHALGFGTCQFAGPSAQRRVRSCHLPFFPIYPPYVPLPMGLWPMELRSRSARRRSWEFLGGSWASTRNPSTPQPHLPINASAPQPCPAEWAVRLNNKYYVVYVRVVVMLLCVRCYVWY